MHKLIDSINATIASVFKNTSDVQIFGLAESVAARDKSGERVVPAIVFPDGECYDVYGLADIHKATIYHRLQNSQFNSTTSFGSFKSYEKVSDISLIVFGERKCYDQFVLADSISAAIGKRSDVTLLSVNHNLLQVFSDEYNGLSCFLNPDYFLFRINYRLTSAFDRCSKVEKL